MTAYNTTDLYNKQVEEDASAAFLSSCISDDTYRNILLSHNSKLYTPNYFIRIGMGILTIVAIVFSGTLLGLIFGTDGSAGFTALLIFYTLLSYTALEFFVKQKHYYNAGIDNILMLSTLIFILSALFIEDYYNQYLVAAAVSAMVCLWLCIRFTDAFMAILFYVSFIYFLFLLFIKLGDIAKATMPFMLMAVSAAVYFTINKIHSKDQFRFYQYCCKAVTLCALLTFYICGNYFVVKELSNEMFDLQLGLNDPIPFGWFFWILTFAVPLLYIFYGTKKKDLLFIRTGLLLIAVTIFTVRYYHSILDIEVAMMIAGLILINISYALIKYLKTPKHGFTFANTGATGKELLNAEALIIAQTFGKQTTANSGVQFGGGSSGGGGASGDF